MTLHTIVCATDFSPASEHAMRVAVRFASEANAELVLLHAWYIPPSAFADTFPAGVIDKLVADARHRLEAAVQECVAAGAKRVASELLTGVPWAEVVEHLEKRAADLCVIGTHGRTGIARIVMGSVAEQIIRHAPCPVVAIRPDAEVKPFARVLVPTDFSESAAYAADLAADLVLPNGTITLLHVNEVPLTYSREYSIGELVRDLGKLTAAALDREAARLKTKTNARIEVRSRTGYPGAQTLAELDDDRSYDLVVLGSHGRTGIKRALMGSVAEKVVRHARGPVLVAKRRG
jgi:nucleotide-binding universal stress UspA family protein